MVKILDSRKEFIFPEDVKGWLSPGEGKLLFELAQITPLLGVVVELGSYYGRSTICLAQGSKKVNGGKVFAVDRFIGGSDIGPEPDFYNQFKQNIRRYGLADHIFAIRGNTVEVAKDWRKPIRLLFLDASHFYEDVSRDLRAWEKYITPQGIIAFHDSVDWPGVNKVVCYLIRSGNFKDFRTFRGPGSTGVTYAVKKVNDESVSELKRYKELLKFKFICLPKLPGRIRQTIKERGEKDIWFRIFVPMANFWKKLTARKF